MQKTQIDGKRILARHLKADRDPRTKVSLYLSQALYQRFRKACGRASSKVMEDLMEAFLDSLKSHGKGG